MNVKDGPFKVLGLPIVLGVLGSGLSQQAGATHSLIGLPLAIIGGALIGLAIGMAHFRGRRFQVLEDRGERWTP